MTQVNKSPQKKDSQLPQIKAQQKDSCLPQISKKQLDSQSVSESSQNLQNQDNNHLPLTHGKKKRKHRRKVRKHSPQYYEQLKAKKLNKKLEQKWDNHFINDHIPDLFQRKKTTAGRTTSKITGDKRAITALQHQSPGKTAAIKKQTMPLPRIQKSNKRSKSFNIHLVQQKKEQPQTKPQQKKPQQLQSIQKQNPAPTKKRQLFDEYKKKITDAFEQVKFLHCHKELLQIFLQLIEKKSVRQMIDKQLGNIRKKQALISKVITSISNRENCIDKVKSVLGNKRSNQKDAAESVDFYRTSTLAVVEDVLKWKENWQEVYRQLFKKNKHFDLVYKTQNYLLTVASSTDQILALFHKVKQDKSINQEKSPQKKQPSTKNIQKQKTVQKQQNSYRNLQQQAKSPQKPQLNNKPEQVSKTQTNLSEQNKVSQQKKPQTQKKLQSNDKVQKPKIPSQSQCPILTNDPFLISLFSIQKEDKNVILKIRACQLLLLQEQYNFLKKDQ